MTPTRRASTSLLALVLSLLPAAGAAQTSVRAPQATATPPATSLAFHRPSIDGAPADATIHRIVQDHDGAMWFATSRGLFEYDGYTSRRFASDPRDPDALAGVDVATILVDRDGRIWAAGTLGTAGWLDRLDPRTGAVEHLPHTLFALSSRAGSEPVGLHLAENGDVWIGTNTGLHRWERVTNKVLLRVDGTVDRAPLDAVTRIVAGGPGELWLGTPTGLHRYEPASGAREAMDALAGEYVTALRRDDDGAVWVGTRSGGLARLDPGTREAVRYRRDLADASSLPGDSVRDLLRDRDGRLLVATETGLARHVAPQLPAAPQADPARGTFVVFRHDPADARSLSHDDVRSLYQDASGLVWIGTARGLAQINPSAARFEQLRSSEAHGLHSPLVWDLAGDADGTLWIATLAGLERYNPDTREVRLYVPSPNDGGLNQLQSVHVDRRNNIWVGAVSGHLYFFSATTGMFTAVPRTGVDGRRFSVNRIWYIGEGDDGRLWIAADEGLFALDVGTRAVVEDLVGDELPAGFAPARTMLTDSDGVVWFGGGRGLVRYETGRGVTATLARDPANRESLRNDAVRALHETADGALWIGTHDGLAKLSRNDRRDARNAFRAYGTAQGLGGDAVYGIVPENDGRHLWLGTSAGLTRFDTVDGTFVNFTTEDGLTAHETNGGAELVTRDGRIWFGTVEGVTSVDPRTLYFNAQPPPVRIVRVERHDGKELPARPQEALRFAQDAMAVSIDFAAMDFQQPRKNRYRFRLLGPADSAWIETARPSVSFAMLPPAYYRFEVVGSNNDGVWSTEPAVLEFRVDAPWWRRAAGWLGYALAAVLAWLLFRAYRARPVGATVS